MTLGKGLELLALGRVSMDLFSRDLGAPFEQIRGFDAHVGGSPCNIAVGASRLGVRAALLTAVGDDKVGDWVVRGLQREGVATDYVGRKPGTRTPLALLGIEPPDRFPLTFYRENPADIALTIDDVDAAPIADCRCLLLSGTAPSRGSCREATFHAAAVAADAGVTTVLDLDLRPDQWHHPRAYGVTMRALLPLIEVVVGTEEEVFAALAPDPGAVAGGAPLPPARHAELPGLIERALAAPTGPKVLLLKRGARGVSVFRRGAPAPTEVPGFPATVVNTVGAGDAFAAGLIAAWLESGDWQESARFANACGALMVARHGCSNAMPRRDEVAALLAEFDGTAANPTQDPDAPQGRSS